MPYPKMQKRLILPYAVLSSFLTILLEKSEERISFSTGIKEGSVVRNFSF